MPAQSTITKRYYLFNSGTVDARIRARAETKLDDPRNPSPGSVTVGISPTEVSIPPRQLRHLELTAACGTEPGKFNLASAVQLTLLGGGILVRTPADSPLLATPPGGRDAQEVAAAAAAAYAAAAVGGSAAAPAGADAAATGRAPAARGSSKSPRRGGPLSASVGGGGVTAPDAPYVSVCGAVCVPSLAVVDVSIGGPAERAAAAGGDRTAYESWPAPAALLARAPLRDIVSLGCTLQGARVAATLTLVNPSDLPVSFNAACVRSVCRPAVRADGRAARGESDLDALASRSFLCAPTDAVIPAGGAHKVLVLFAPPQVPGLALGPALPLPAGEAVNVEPTVWTCEAIFEMHFAPDPAAGRPAGTVAAGRGSRDATAGAQQSRVSAPPVSIRIEARSVPACLQLGARTLTFGTVLVDPKRPTAPVGPDATVRAGDSTSRKDGARRQQLALRNPLPVPIEVTLSSIPSFAAAPSRLLLQPHATADLGVEFAPSHLGTFDSSIAMSVAGLASVPIRVRGAAAPYTAPPPPPTTTTKGSGRAGSARASTKPADDVARTTASAPHATRDLARTARGAARAAGGAPSTVDMLDRTSLGLVGMEGLREPGLALPRKTDPLAVADPRKIRGLREWTHENAAAAGSLVGPLAGGSNGPVDVRLSDCKLAAVVFPAVPTTPKERREALTPLVPATAALVRILPASLDIVGVTAGAPSTHPFYVANGAPHAITVQLGDAADVLGSSGRITGASDGVVGDALAPEVAGSGPRSMCIPAGCIGAFKCVLFCATPQAIPTVLKLNINASHRMRLPVFAHAAPLRAEVHPSLLELLLPDATIAPYGAHTITVTSQSNVPAVMSWVIRPHGDSQTRTQRRMSVAAGAAGASVPRTRNASNSSGGRAAEARDKSHPRDVTVSVTGQQVALPGEPCLFIEPPYAIVPPNTTFTFKCIHRPLPGTPRELSACLDLYMHTAVDTNALPAGAASCAAPLAAISIPSQAAVAGPATATSSTVLGAAMGMLAVSGVRELNSEAAMVPVATRRRTGAAVRASRAAAELSPRMERHAAAARACGVDAFVPGTCALVGSVNVTALVPEARFAIVSATTAGDIRNSRGRVDLGAVPVGGTRTATVTFVNPSATPTVLSLDMLAPNDPSIAKPSSTKAPIPGVGGGVYGGPLASLSVHPTRLRLAPGETGSATVLLRGGTGLGQVTGALVVDGRGCRSRLKVTVCGETAAPCLSVEVAGQDPRQMQSFRIPASDDGVIADSFVDFGSSFVGARSMRVLRLVNNSASLPAIVLIDLRASPEFTIVDPTTSSPISAALSASAAAAVLRPLVATDGGATQRPAPADGPSEVDLLLEGRTSAIFVVPSADDDTSVGSEADAPHVAVTPSSTQVLAWNPSSSTAAMAPAPPPPASDGGSDISHQDGVAYVLRVPPGGSTSFGLMFAPLSARSVSFRLAASLAGLPPPPMDGEESVSPAHPLSALYTALAPVTRALRVLVTGRAVRPVVQLSTSTIDFGPCVASTGASVKRVHKRMLRIFNADTQPLSWALGIVPQTDNGSGTLEMQIRRVATMLPMRRSGTPPRGAGAPAIIAALVPDATHGDGPRSSIDVADGGVAALAQASDATSHSQPLNARGVHVSTAAQLVSDTRTPSGKPDSDGARGEHRRDVARRPGPGGATTGGGQLLGEMTSSPAFVLRPEIGRLQPGESVTVHVTFTPDAVGPYEERIPLYIDSDYSNPYALLTARGTATYPTITFDPPILRLPVIPPDASVFATLHLANDGYEAFDLDVQCPAIESGAVPLALFFPHGRLLSANEPTMPIEVHYVPRGLTAASVAALSAMDPSSRTRKVRREGVRAGEGPFDSRNLIIYRGAKPQAVDVPSFAVDVTIRDPAGNCFSTTITGGYDRSILSHFPFSSFIAPSFVTACAANSALVALLKRLNTAAYTKRSAVVATGAAADPVRDGAVGFPDCSVPTSALGGLYAGRSDDESPLASGQPGNPMHHALLTGAVVSASAASSPHPFWNLGTGPGDAPRPAATPTNAAASAPAAGTVATPAAAAEGVDEDASRALLRAPWFVPVDLTLDFPLRSTRSALRADDAGSAATRSEASAGALSAVGLGHVADPFGRWLPVVDSALAAASSRRACERLCGWLNAAALSAPVDPLEPLSRAFAEDGARLAWGLLQQLSGRADMVPPQELADARPQPSVPASPAASDAPPTTTSRRMSITPAARTVERAATAAASTPSSPQAPVVGLRAGPVPAPAGVSPSAAVPPSLAHVKVDAHALRLLRQALGNVYAADRMLELLREAGAVLPGVLPEFLVPYMTHTIAAPALSAHRALALCQVARAAADLSVMEGAIDAARGAQHDAVDTVLRAVLGAPAQPAPQRVAVASPRETKEDTSQQSRQARGTAVRAAAVAATAVNGAAAAHDSQRTQRAFIDGVVRSKRRCDARLLDEIGLPPLTLPRPLSLRRFTSRANAAWMAVLLQALNVFVFATNITWSSLTSAPVARSGPMLRAALIEQWYGPHETAADADTAHAAVPGASPRTQRGVAAASAPGETAGAPASVPSRSDQPRRAARKGALTFSSDPFAIGGVRCSASESVLLRWLSIHLTGVYGLQLAQARDQRPDWDVNARRARDALHGITHDVLVQPFVATVTDFSADLRDGLAVAAVLVSYAPHLMPQLHPRTNAAFSVPAMSIAERESNWAAVLRCIADLAVFPLAPPVAPQDLAAGVQPIDGLLLAAFLYLRLPAFLAPAAPPPHPVPTVPSAIAEQRKAALPGATQSARPPPKTSPIDESVADAAAYCEAARVGVATVSFAAQLGSQMTAPVTVTNPSAGGAVAHSVSVWPYVPTPVPLAASVPIPARAALTALARAHAALVATPPTLAVQGGGGRSDGAAKDKQRDREASDAYIESVAAAGAVVAQYPPWFVAQLAACVDASAHAPLMKQVTASVTSLHIPCKGSATFNIIAAPRFLQPTSACVSVIPQSVGGLLWGPAAKPYVQTAYLRVAQGAGSEQVAVVQSPLYQPADVLVTVRNPFKEDGTFVISQVPKVAPHPQLPLNVPPYAIPTSLFATVDTITIPAGSTATVPVTFVPLVFNGNVPVPSSDHVAAVEMTSPRRADMGPPPQTAAYVTLLVLRDPRIGEFIVSAYGSALPPPSTEHVVMPVATIDIDTKAITRPPPRSVTFAVRNVALERAVAIASDRFRTASLRFAAPSGTNAPPSRASTPSAAARDARKGATAKSPRSFTPQTSAVTAPAGAPGPRYRVSINGSRFSAPPFADIRANGTVEVPVTFAPHAAGKYTASLVLTDGGDVRLVTIEGQCRPAAGAACVSFATGPRRAICQRLPVANPSPGGTAPVTLSVSLNGLQVSPLGPDEFAVRGKGVAAAGLGAATGMGALSTGFWCPREIRIAPGAPVGYLPVVFAMPWLVPPQRPVARTAADGKAKKITGAALEAAGAATQALAVSATVTVQAPGDSTNSATYHLTGTVTMPPSMGTLELSVPARESGSVSLLVPHLGLRRAQLKYDVLLEMSPNSEVLAIADADADAPASLETADLIDMSVLEPFVVVPATAFSSGAISGLDAEVTAAIDAAAATAAVAPLARSTSLSAVVSPLPTTADGVPAVPVTLTLRPLQSGTLRGRIYLTIPPAAIEYSPTAEPPPYLWWDVVVHAARPSADTATCVLPDSVYVRLGQPTEVPMVIHVPSSRHLTLALRAVPHGCVTAQRRVVAPPDAPTTVSVSVMATSLGRTSATVYLEHPALIDVVRTMEVVGLPLLPTVVEDVDCELGLSASRTITLINPTDAPVVLHGSVFRASAAEGRVWSRARAGSDPLDDDAATDGDENAAHERELADVLAGSFTSDPVSHVTVSPPIVHLAGRGVATVTVTFVPPPGLTADGELVAIRYVDRATAAALREKQASTAAVAGGAVAAADAPASSMGIGALTNVLRVVPRPPRTPSLLSVTAPIGQTATTVVQIRNPFPYPVRYAAALDLCPPELLAGDDADAAAAEPAHVPASTPALLSQFSFVGRPVIDAPAGAVVAVPLAFAPTSAAPCACLVRVAMVAPVHSPREAADASSPPAGAAAGVVKSRRLLEGAAETAVGDLSWRFVVRGLAMRVVSSLAATMASAAHSPDAAKARARARAEATDASPGTTAPRALPVISALPLRLSTAARGEVRRVFALPTTFVTDAVGAEPTHVAVSSERVGFVVQSAALPHETATLEARARRGAPSATLGALVRSAIAVTPATRADWLEQLAADGVEDVDLSGDADAPVPVVCAVAYVSVYFAPLRAFTASAALVVTPASLGETVFPLLLSATAPQCDDVILIPPPPGGVHAAAARSASVSFRLANAGPVSAVAACYFEPNAPAGFAVFPPRLVLPPAHAAHDTRPRITVVWQRGRTAPSSTQTGRLVVATGAFEWRFDVRFGRDGDAAVTAALP